MCEAQLSPEATHGCRSLLFTGHFCGEAASSDQNFQHATTVRMTLHEQMAKHDVAISFDGVDLPVLCLVLLFASCSCG